ncbi:MAG: hypothetical protein VYD64_08780 [Pseudomonadota bacterium]|nr:hypothetical protein [Pseudomonadota bacterium]
MEDHQPVPVTGPWYRGEPQFYERTVDALLAAGSERKRKRCYSALTAACETDALMAALARADRPWMARLLSRLTRRKSRRAGQWIHATLADLRNWEDRDAWSVTALTDNAVLFRTGGEPASKTLVVGFTGRSHWLMLPTYKVLKALGAQGHDLLLLRDPQDRFYQDGIPGHGGNPVDTAAALAAWIGREGYGDTIAIGTSAGHLMALFTTLHNGWRHAMLVGGTDPSYCPVFDELFATMVQDDAVSMHHCFAADHARNRRSAQVLADRFGQTRLFPYPGATRHNLLEEIDEISDAIAYIRLHLVTPQAA